ncbi:Indoleamine 2,3-dioxygenase [Hondaea fermentalgiana]|uniref:Indoleamine 2,3-dioxygenase n=1 Tax=Hondaea fermentalgiana TaxID=2315210 RepID=A0A2R5GG39_9STRA|nr:Indoleamine 2,3-dioxygenase [Hondaea fermentalgiana]|eukprot:GBG27613.1 Indoleamine 2,3-dioxygenase [Hondaea fermentalgiana]
MEKSTETHWDPARNGFLPANPNRNFFCEALREHISAYDDLPELARERSIGHRLENLRVLDIVFEYEAYYDPISCVLLAEPEECESVFTLFGILAGAYVHKDTVEFSQGEAAAASERRKEGPIVLPACISVPLKKLAEHLGRQPILDYAGCVLSNWTLIDADKPMTPSNVRVLRTFTRTVSEEWFYKIHAVIEHYGAEAITSSVAIVDTLDSLFETRADVATYDARIPPMVLRLRAIENALKQMNIMLGRMRERCREVDFFNIVRPWLSAWPEPGVVYSTRDSSDLEPEKYTGGSGAQSSIMPCIDALFGVGHGAKQVAQEQSRVEGARVAIKQTETVAKHAADREMFLAALKRYRKYMPPPHRRFIERLENSSSLRDLICEMEDLEREILEQSRNRNLPVAVHEPVLRDAIHLGQNIVHLKEAYNGAMNEIIKFRQKHVGITVSYITSQAKIRAASLQASGSASTGQELLKKSSKGTGGSNFQYHLTQHIRDSRSCLYELPKNLNPAPRPPESHVMPSLGSRLPISTLPQIPNLDLISDCCFSSFFICTKWQ